MIKNILQGIGITAVLMVLVAFSIVAMYFSYILGIGLLIISLVVIISYCVGLMNTDT